MLDPDAHPSTVQHASALMIDDLVCLSSFHRGHLNSSPKFQLDQNFIRRQLSSSLASPLPLPPVRCVLVFLLFQLSAMYWSFSCSFSIQILFSSSYSAERFCVRTASPFPSFADKLLI
jgi:hypothetical protein